MPVTEWALPRRVKADLAGTMKSRSEEQAIVLEGPSYGCHWYGINDPPTPPGRVIRLRKALSVTQSTVVASSCERYATSAPDMFFFLSFCTFLSQLFCYIHRCRHRSRRKSGNESDSQF